VRASKTTKEDNSRKQYKNESAVGNTCNVRLWEVLQEGKEHSVVVGGKRVDNTVGVKVERILQNPGKQKRIWRDLRLA
jgi:hypothetical protein